MEIVCYLGGTCGDLVAAVIDPTGARLLGPAVHHASDRVRLKKPHLFDDNTAKDTYLRSVSANSISSHDLDYHVRRKHNFITIVISNRPAADWAAERFRALHRPEVWQEMQEKCGAQDVDGYAQIMLDYSNMVIQHAWKHVNLEDIIAGRLISVLQQDFGIIPSPRAQDFYRHWIESQEL